jgi:hypothetical protein
MFYYSKQGQRRIYRQSKLVMPKEQWPSVAGSGIAMSYLNTVDGFLYFKFDHNSHYQDVQKQFIKAVDTVRRRRELDLIGYCMLI